MKNTLKNFTYICLSFASITFSTELQALSDDIRDESENGLIARNPARVNPAPQDPAPQDPSPQDPSPQDRVHFWQIIERDLERGSKTRGELIHNNENGHINQ